MKIKKIVIKNINSLKGKWTIDLEHPDYKKNHNQFVISGETGAGKTTILDGITLALYGKTPRMEEMNVSKVEEAYSEIMTRHTTESMAQVVYECRQGEFESTFVIHRARGKSDGNLKISFNIKNLHTNEISNTITAHSRIEDETKKITNLGYEQFCRSMLLAQGKFDKFIGSDERKRAEILATISGNDYAKLAEYIHDIADLKIKDFKEKEQKLNSIELLSDEDEKSLLSEQKETPNKIEAKKKEIDESKENLNWLLQLEKLEAELKNAEIERAAYEQEKADFSENEIILKNADKAFACQLPYEQWEQLDKDQNNDYTSLEKKRTELTKNENELFELTENFKKLNEELSQKKDEEKSLRTEWKEARKLIIQKTSEKKNLDAIEKRKKEADEKLSKGKEDKNNLNSDINRLEEEKIKHKKYLELHKIDENLVKVIPTLTEKQKSVESILKNIDIEKKNLQKAQEEIQDVEKSIQNSENELSVKDNTLKEFVATKYLLVSQMLRTSLSDGKACPVCGSIEHPFCTEKGEDIAFGNEKLESKNDANDVASKISALTNEIDELKNIIQELIQKKASFLAKKNNAENSLQTAQKNLDVLCGEMNSILADWKVSVSFEDVITDKGNLEKILNDLKLAEENFNSHKEEFEKVVTDLKEKNTKLEGINIDALESEAQKEELAFIKQKESFEEIIQKLSSISDGMYSENSDVDKAESQFEKSLNNLEESVKIASDEKSKKAENKTEIEGAIKILKTNIEQRKNQLEDAFNKLKKAFDENGFYSEISFDESVAKYKKCFVDKNKINELKEAQENLKKKDTETITNKKIANDKLREHKNSKKSNDSFDKDELFSKKEKFESEYEELSARLGEIKSQLKANEEQKQKVANLKKEIDSQRSEKDKWQNINDMLGKKDGSDFQTFVQALTFRNLIKKANKYFEKILPNYSLVQVPGKVDFKIHSNTFAENKDDRDVGNMSGGEKFIISLSFALGLAELASHNVKVDSLFLDEGFGTLSGEPLYDSIKALKALELSGKMLGIITHVTEVINEFPQRIEAKANKGVTGYSELKGAGVYCDIA